MVTWCRRTALRWRWGRSGASPRVQRARGRGDVARTRRCRSESESVSCGRCPHLALAPYASRTLGRRLRRSPPSPSSFPPSCSSCSSNRCFLNRERTHTGSGFKKSEHAHSCLKAPEQWTIVMKWFDSESTDSRKWIKHPSAKVRRSSAL